MKEIVQIEFLDIEENDEYKELINAVINRCFEEEKLINTKLYISITLTTPENIRNINKEYRNTDKETDVLSFPMFEQEEIKEIINSKQHLVEDVLGDIVISVKKVQEQAIEYGHSFKRELSYMLVHGFYHLMGYDHIKEEDKKEMRPKEEKILQDLNIIRN
ncbi:MAG: rRNA maturation RNase YbeY [Clostridia bacterium]|nr:rRNA maturation RNase YbeY [Clostridia bacterium]